MTYRIEQFVRKISSPIIVKFDGKETMFANGETLAASFTSDKPISIRSIKAANDAVILELMKNELINDTSWSDADQNFF